MGEPTAPLARAEHNLRNALQLLYALLEHHREGLVVPVERVDLEAIKQHLQRALDAVQGGG